MAEEEYQREEYHTESSNGSGTFNLPRKRSSSWKDNEILHLIDIWQEMAEDLRKVKRNGHIYVIIARRLRANNVDRTTAEVRNKIQNLTREYRREKIKHSSGATTSEWKFWDAVHQVVGCLPTQDDELAPDMSMRLPIATLPNADEMAESSDEMPECKPEITLSTQEDPAPCGDPPGFSSRRQIRNGSSQDVFVKTMLQLLEEQRQCRMDMRASEQKFTEILARQTQLQERSVELHETFIKLVSRIVDTN